MTQDALNINITPEDIDRSHRVGPRKKNKSPRPIIVKFKSYRVKEKVYKAKNRIAFANRNVHMLHMHEDLTKARLSMFKKATELKKAYLILDTWTTDGNIFIRDMSATVRRF